MAHNDSPFAGTGRVSPFIGTGGRASPFSGTGSALIEEPRRGILSTIIHETALDIKGTAKVAGATGGELLNLLGANVPLTFDDLTQRDLKGALMIAALTAGGFAGGAIRGLGLFGTGAKAGATTVLTRAGATTVGETVAGAAFGLIRPLDEDESRLRSVVGDAAFFGGLGLGASFMKSAVKATIGAQIANIKKAGSIKRLAQAAESLQAEQLVKESAGIQLLNPDTGAKRAIRKKLDGTTTIISFSESGGVASRESSESFSGALAQAVQDGFVDELGAFNTKLFRGIEKQIDDTTLALIESAGGNIETALGTIRLGEYAQVRDAAKLAREAGAEFGALVGEVLAVSSKLGEVVLEKSTRAKILQELSLGSKAGAKLSDADVLRQAFRKGLVDVESATAGFKSDQFFRELLINDLIPKGQGIDIVINRHADLIFGSILLPSRIASLHPIVEPLFKNADNRAKIMAERVDASRQFLSELSTGVSNKNRKLAVKIIDESAAGGLNIEQARAGAKATAAATQNQEVITFVDRVTDELSKRLGEAQATEILGEGISGYFPLVNANQYRLSIDRGLAEGFEFQGFHSTKAAAKEELKRVRAANPNIDGFITPNSFWHEDGSLLRLKPSEIAKTRSAMREVFGEEFGPQIAEVTEGIIPKIPGRATFAGARKRVLGIRDFSRDPIEALAAYFNGFDRAIAFADFERQAAPILASIPESQSALKAYAQQYVDDVLGRPRQVEQVFQAVLEHLGLDPGPKALARYTGMLKKWESFSRLGGFMSGIINLTQIATNTVAVLGVKDTLRGFEVFNPKRYNHIVETLEKNGFNVNHYMPLTQEGLIGHFGSPVTAIREKRFAEALHRMALFLFNGAERTNRLVTAWGAFKSQTAKGVDDKTAAAFAEQVVNRTQFNYRITNMPEILRSPVGSVIFQFKSFVINEIDFIASMSKEELARFSASIWALGGASLLLNFPGTDLIDQAGLIFTDRKLSEAAKISADSALEKSLIFGLPGLVDFDVSDYVGIGSVRDITRGLFGPAVSDAKVFTDFIVEASKDIAATRFVTRKTKDRFFQRIVPSARRRYTRAKEIFQTGEVRSPYSGKLIYKPDSRLREAIPTFIGIPTLELQQQRAADAVTSRIRDRFIRGHSAFAKEAAQAVIAGDQQRASQIIHEAAASGFAVSNQTLKYWVREMSQSAAQRRRRRLPLTNRQELDELYEATGTLTRPKL